MYVSNVRKLDRMLGGVRGPAEDLFVALVHLSVHVHHDMPHVPAVQDGLREGGGQPFQDGVRHGGPGRPPVLEEDRPIARLQPPSSVREPAEDLVQFGVPCWRSWWRARVVRVLFAQPSGEVGGDLGKGFDADEEVVVHEIRIDFFFCRICIMATDTFNQLLRSFLTELAQTFPEDVSVKLALPAFDAIVARTPKHPLTLFMDVAGPHAEAIASRDVAKLRKASMVVAGVDVSRYLNDPGLSDASREAIVGYLSTLYMLGVSVSALPEPVMAMIEQTANAIAGQIERGETSLSEVAASMLSDPSKFLNM